MKEEASPLLLTLSLASTSYEETPAPWEYGGAHLPYMEGARFGKQGARVLVARPPDGDRDARLRQQAGGRARVGLAVRVRL